MTSAETKILRFLDKHGAASPVELARLFRDGAGRDYVAETARSGLIVRRMMDSSAYELTPAGALALRAARDITRRRWLDRLWGFLSGIAVTLICGFIIQCAI